MSSGFVTEAELEERRRLRQEEWEKVRKPDEPKEAPEEEYDNRTLFERLEEQRKKKEFEYEETHRLKNMIKGLDDDEIEFLDMVDRTKMEQEKRLQDEEAKELQQFRSKKAALKEQTAAKKIEDEITPVISTLSETFSSGVGTPHNKVLANILRKRVASEKLPNSPTKKKVTEEVPNSSPLQNDNQNEVAKSPKSNPSVYPSAMQCIGILPGIGSYISDDSSDSENTSGSELEDNVYDLLGQKVAKDVKSSSKEVS